MGVGVRLSAVQFELDNIMHGLMANPDRKFVYGEMVGLRPSRPEPYELKISNPETLL